MPSGLGEIINAFRPDTAIDEPTRFTGRAEQLKSLTQALHSPGSCPMIIGDRGLGKSSLAQQVRLIAMGDTALLQRYQLAEWAIPKSESYIALLLSCTDAMRDTNGILRALTSGVASVMANQGLDKRYRLEEKATKSTVSLKVFSHERTKMWRPESFDKAILRTSQDYEQALIDYTSRLSDAYESPVLLIVDEIDRVHDKAGLASYIKAATAPNLKFMLVGIAQNVADLISDHQSIERSLASVHVKPMSRQELDAIVQRAVLRLRGKGVNFSFEPSVVRSLSQIASGFPWFVHVLGQEALLHAFTAKSTVVEQKHLGAAVTTLASNRFAQQFSDLYQQAVKDSYSREIVLRTFAMWDDRDIPTSEIYPIAKKLGVTNPSTYRQQLCAASSGRVLVAPPFQAKGMVRFSNEMFKIYIRLRQSIYANVRERVDYEWKVSKDPTYDPTFADVPTGQYL